MKPFWIACSCVLVSVSAYEFERGPVPKQGHHPDDTFPCPGLYCGRSSVNETHWSGCGACPRGWRIANNTHSICLPCSEHPGMYDWFFLAFHVIIVLVLNWMAIDLSACRRAFTKELFALHVSVVLEVSLASLCSLVVVEPVGQLNIVACKVERLSDWYTFFLNPHPNYEEALVCTQEAVYPLYMLIFIFYGFCTAFMLILRPLLACKLMPRRGKSAIFAALYFLPTLALIHATIGGLIYVTYPYLVFVLSIISSATHFAHKLDQNAKSLFLSCFKESRNAIILLGHWLLHAFGVLAITQLKDPVMNLSLLALTPLPAIFYLVTAKFSDPANFKNEM